LSLPPPLLCYSLRQTWLQSTSRNSTNCKGVTLTRYVWTAMPRTRSGHPSATASSFASNVPAYIEVLGFTSGTPQLHLAGPKHEGNESRRLRKKTGKFNLDTQANVNRATDTRRTRPK
ncbi:hypothetical protein BC938DRAFT_483481, partial [Jimgerdemannia flammicorona]